MKYALTFLAIVFLSGCNLTPDYRTDNSLNSVKKVWIDSRYKFYNLENTKSFSKYKQNTNKSKKSYVKPSIASIWALSFGYNLGVESFKNKTKNNKPTSYKNQKFSNNYVANNSQITSNELANFLLFY